MSFFGANIKKIRQIKGLSQKAFADLFDLNRGVISSYEEERAEPKIETLLKVAHYFNLTLDELLTETIHITHLANVSDINQLMLFPELAIQNSKEPKTKTEENNPNALILQKILASVDLVYEFTSEKQLLAQYNYGDIIFLNKSDLKNDSLSNLLLHKDGHLQYASEIKIKNTDHQEYYKIVGYVSTADKNIFTDIFKRLENLENKVKN
ncbi:hypothetical protein BOQ62_16325 [Chryseobacterium sp. CH21]|uniref:helix-turn-helix domain-containing protein n=1 Tax=Chryseobacterium sp. CH21 TaxID=713556 RepID=UPI00100ABE15|nr:helix-turn-helix transcriptional regulator [Chryseobacterium sp. CH21]RXM38631.1 hypothetical protein BOQ62_16325 [Chryseobacterium sp. CH21]